MGALIGEIFVQEGHVFCLKCLLAVPIFEVGVDAARVDDLVRWSQSEVQESWNRDGWDAIGK